MMRFCVLLSLLMGIYNAALAQPSYIDDRYTCSIVQGNDTIALSKIDKTEVHLKREKFKFIFNLNSTNYVYFIASHTDEYYKTKPSRPFPTCLMFCGGAVGADNMFNPDKDICVYGFAQGISCWYYDSTTDHRFDAPAKITANGKEVTRTIESLFDYNKQKNTSLKKIKPQTDLYIVFSEINTEPCDECESRTDDNIWRKYLKITFD